MKRIKVIVSGKVQGVYFRATTETVATTLSLTGFVRNERNGDVYIEAQGNEEDLEKLVDWCKRGPERARVDEVVASDIELISETTFGIKR